MDRAAASPSSTPWCYVTIEVHFVTADERAGVKRPDGAKAWSTVLSELAQVRVLVEWERPTWRVSWCRTVRLGRR